MYVKYAYVLCNKNSLKTATIKAQNLKKYVKESFNWL